jgi:tetratricopeptide (TPR) repeat protein
MNANHADTYNNLGVALKNLQAYDAAIRAFDTAMRIDPELASAPFNLAALYFRRGEREQAARLFDFVVRSFPELKGQADPYLKALR